MVEETEEGLALVIHVAIFLVSFVLLFVGLGLGLQVSGWAALGAWIAAFLLFVANLVLMKRC